MDTEKLLREYIACQSVSSDNSLRHGMAAARSFLVNFFNELSIEAEEVQTGGHPAIFAQTEQRPGAPTVIMYGHYDVQPADNANLWNTDPFKMATKDGHFWGRGVSDNKGPHLAMLLGVADIIATKKQLPINIKFLLEGEEEVGSTNIAHLLRNMKDRLAADFAIIADTWALDDKHIVITTGLRGLVGCELDLIGMPQDIHSGYGGGILNPVQALVKICSKLHTDTGAVNVEHFYDDVVFPSDDERKQLQILKLSDDELTREFGVSTFQRPYQGFSATETMRFFPSLEFNGISGGFQGEGIKTIIPAKAHVKISCRLVPNQDPNVIKSLLQTTFHKLCPQGMQLNVKFEQASKPYAIDLNNGILSTASTLAEEEISKVFGAPPAYLREGGSIGLVPTLKDILGIDSLMLGFSTSNDNIHAPNENISISMLEKAREFFKNFICRFSV